MKAYILAKEIVIKLNSAGYKAYFAGGWVRDYSMKLTSCDVDIATSAPPQVILELFPKTLSIGLAFGIVVVIVEGHQFEVATFRRDIDYIDGRKPTKIELARAEEDAQRRDFTINGMFYDPIAEIVLDYVGGLEDIQKNIIRTIGEPHQRFLEDRLRMIRAVRFAARFDFLIEKETQDAIKEYAPTLFPSVAIERVWQELTKMSHYPGYDHALIQLFQLDLLQVIFPELKKISLEEMYERVSSFCNLPKDFPTILYLLNLFPNASKLDLETICTRLKVSAKERKLLEFAFKGIQLQKKSDADLVEKVKFYANPDFQFVLNLILAGLKAELRDEVIIKYQADQKILKNHILRIKEKKPLINAKVLHDAGISDGKLTGLLMREGEKIAITSNLDDALKILSLLKKTTLWPN